MRQIDLYVRPLDLLSGDPCVFLFFFFLSRNLRPVEMQITVQEVLWNVCKNIEQKNRPDINELSSNKEKEEERRRKS